MRSVINTIANLTTSGIGRNQVRTAKAGVDTVRASLHQLRLFAAPVRGPWTYADGDQPFAGKQKPAGTGSMPGGSDLLSRRAGESSRCRRPRVSSCLARS